MYIFQKIYICLKKLNFFIFFFSRLFLAGQGIFIIKESSSAELTKVCVLQQRNFPPIFFPAVDFSAHNSSLSHKIPFLTHIFFRGPSTQFTLVFFPLLPAACPPSPQRPSTQEAVDEEGQVASSQYARVRLARALRDALVQVTPSHPVTPIPSIHFCLSWGL